MLVIVEFKLILPEGADTALGPPGVCDLVPDTVIAISSSFRVFI